MTPRRTTTGGVLESMILPALTHGGYTVRKQVHVGERMGGRKHKVDAVATKDAQHFLVSLKWQQTSGTAEQKVPFEIMCLADAIHAGAGTKAYLVLGGEGWTLRKFYTGGGLAKRLVGCEHVEVITLEAFIARANRGEL